MSKFRQLALSSLVALFCVSYVFAASDKMISRREIKTTAVVIAR